jgi:DNA-binding NarL/FixJ family response regulator
VDGDAARALVGRGREIELLEGALDAARRGEGRTVVVVGEAGAGKTSVARAAMAVGGRAGMAVRFGRCLQLEIERPFGGFLDALDARASALLGPSMTISRTVLEAGAISATRFLVAERLIEHIEALAEQSPVLLVVEDLHWADPATLDLTRLVAERSPDLPLLLLTTARPPYAANELRRLLASDVVETLALEPLEDDAVTDLVRTATGDAPGTRLAAALGRAGGNPLLILSTLEALDGASALRRAGGTIDLATEVTELKPGTAIMARLDEVGRDEMHVLEVAAVLGHVVDPAVVALMLDRPAASVLAAAEEAVALGVLVAEGGSYAFRHELHRAAVLSRLPAAMRSALHLDAARVLAASGAPAIDVAEHFALGAMPGNREAVDWLHRAAVDLVDHAPRAALRLLDTALRLSGTSAATDLLTARVRALAGTGQTAETEALARSLLRDGLDPGVEAQLRRDLAFSYFVQGRMTESVEEIERYGELIDDPSLLAQTSAEIAFGRFVALDHAGAREAASTAIDAGRRAGDVAAQVGGGGMLCWLELFGNRFGAALDLAREITVLADQPNARHAYLYQPRFIASLVHLETDRLEALREDVRRGRELAETYGFAWSMPGYDSMAAYGLLRSGDHDDAAAVAASTLGYLDGVDGFGVALWCHAFLAQIAVHRGDEATALEHLAIADAHLTTGRAQFGFEQTMIAKAWLAERAGQADEAYLTYASTWDAYGAIGVLDGRHALGPDVVRLAVEAGDRDRADEVCAALDEGAALAGTPAFRAFADVARAWRDHDADAAVAAAELMGTTPRRPTAAALLADASVLLRRDRRVADADAVAGRAGSLYAACGADADARRVLGTIAGSAPRLRDRPRFGWDALTRTETTVAELVGDGLSNRDIAGRLVVSRRTVETHVSAIYRKLEVGSRVELVRLVLHRRTEGRLG